MYPAESYVVPYKRLLFDDETKKAVIEHMERGELLQDDEPAYHFEKAFAYAVGKKEAIAVCNGSWAGWLALYGCGIEEGDEVILPACTDYPVANQVVHSRAKPVFVDVDPETQNMDPTKVEEKITERTKAILPVHMMGHPVDMDPILEIARRHGVFVIEDACHSLGARYKGKNLPLGDVGYYSFHGKSLWTVSGGGMVVTNDPKIAERIRFERHHGVLVKGYNHRPPHVTEDGIWEDLITSFSMNYRIAEIAAVIGLHQVKKLPQLVESQRETAKQYTERLAGVPIVPPIEKEWAFHTYTRYVINAPLRNELQSYLKKKGIQTIVSYPAPIPLLGIYAKRYGHKSGDFPVTENIKKIQLSLPEPRCLSSWQVEYVTAMIREFYNENPLSEADLERLKSERMSPLPRP
ncbi:MAG: DegT/DnrJ/EryC1/StrS family aminotransferase [Thaumarchaeota archaeon]|nr:DegT/DnrJ/EryC1/StrS family aminotransferase [Nitrososphaerota archaeon]